MAVYVVFFASAAVIVSVFRTVVFVLVSIVRVGVLGVVDVIVDVDILAECTVVVVILGDVVVDVAVLNCECSF